MFHWSLCILLKFCEFCITLLLHCNPVFVLLYSFILSHVSLCCRHGLQTGFQPIRDSTLSFLWFCEHGVKFMVLRDESYFYCGITVKYQLSPGLCGSVGWVPACELKGCWFNSQSGHMPGLRARSPVRHMREAANWCFFCTSIFLSLFFSPFSSLSKTNKQKTTLFEKVKTNLCAQALFRLNNVSLLCFFPPQIYCSCN